MKTPRALWLLLLLAVSTGNALAQSRAADSLHQLLRNFPRPDTTRVRRLHALISELAATDAPQAIALSRQALTLSQRLTDTVSIGRSLLWLSILHRRLEQYAPARYYTRQARELFAQSHDRRREARACLELSLIDVQQSKPASALAWALQGLPLAEQAREEGLQAQLRGTIGSIYSQLADYTSALPMLRRALRDGQRLNDQQVVSAALSGLASLSQVLRQWPDARRYFRRAIAVSRQMGDTQNETINEIGLAEVCLAQGDLPRARHHGARARALVRATQDDYNLPAVELMLARSFLLAGQPDSAVALAQLGLERSQRSRRNGNISSAADILAQAYAVRQDFAEAYRYQRLFSSYQDTLTGDAVQRKSSALRYNYELEKQQSQITLLNQTRQLQTQKSARQRLQLYALLAGLTGTGLLAGLLWRNARLKQRINRHLNEKNTEIALQRDDLTSTLASLKAAQTQLIQREKMASLGELTAGIAHEIQNPLNFVNNFSEVSTELVEEFIDGPWQQLPEAEKAYATELLDNLTQNLQKITHHGHRADNIVKGMLQHSHGTSGQREPTDLNTLVTEHLPLAYQSFRAKNKDFTITITSDFDPLVGQVKLVPQDVGRVLVNLYANAFYAQRQRQQLGQAGYFPELTVNTKRLATEVQIRVRDNGLGMDAETQLKVFQPFFTTKPSGEGTGLGLSLSYDIIVEGHGGMLTITSQEGVGTEVTISLPV
ncbi:hypothetical protein GCM10022408_27970 [Hymenobacter fastidiosus]|uniref:histidine kinase n=1 Tax=Hymenobacter fastidiosus TaxID=486264 RepID=A0ABP7SLA6_9BACT